MIKTILVATDGSGHAKKAIDLAADIAEKYDARMVILHVLLRHTSEFEIETLCKENAMPTALEEKFDELRKAFLEMVSVSYEAGPMSIIVPDDVLNDVGNLILDNARQRAESKGVKDVSAHIADGSPADTIIAAAEKENADMIVLGSRGLGNIAGLLMGSVSHKEEKIPDWRKTNDAIGVVNGICYLSRKSVMRRRFSVSDEINIRTPANSGRFKNKAVVPE